jgi:hypothetical protein
MNIHQPNTDILMMFDKLYVQLNSFITNRSVPQKAFVINVPIEICIQNLILFIKIQVIQSIQIGV